ncbi:uncharacterized protein LOC580052 [Strongylocentrotus purpuratus]|uniref:Methyltransferase type 11 domain-containing protein n=1 Tax=Strongylocentrotus purpuratus TaxID=7668 RepID=A0A7M7NH64_STRPU|nr:uncharacterized protein LOC580052 [Strongylocentrotus purpuratus]
MDREAESVALEKKHVHDVYERIAPHFSDTRYKAWPRVKEFLLELEPGSIVADVGCGNGKYLGINDQTFKIGSDCCVNLVDISAKRGHEAMVCDNLRLPYRSNCFDAVISIAVVHHFATVERRVQAIQELARICRPGGLVMIYVWALEQKQRQFDAQDVLVPWHLQPKNMRTRRSKGKPNSKNQNHNSSSSASDDDDVKTNKKPDKALNGKTDGKLSKMKVHPAIVSAQNGGMRSRKTKTLQRHTTERDWLREKFPNRRDQPRSEEARVLRKCYSCEESVVLSAKPRVAKTRCQSDSGMSRRMMSRSSSVEEGERGGTMWDGFLQVFPASYSPTSPFRSEDDMTQGDVNSVFGDDDDDDIDENTKNQWCIINKDGSMGFYENGHKSGQSLKNRHPRSHLLLNGSGSCDSILPKHSKPLRNIKKRTSPLLSSQSLDERDFERTSSPRTSLEKFGANRRNLSSFSHNSEGAIDVKNLNKGSDLKASTWSSDTSGFVSNGSVNGECSEATKKLLNWRKLQLKLNLRSDETKEKGSSPWNGVITKSLELLYKSEGKTGKKPVVGLNFTSARGEVFKPLKRRNRLSQSGSEKDLESSFDSVSSSDESLTAYPINPTKQSQLNKEQTPASDLRTRSISLTMLEKLMPKDFKFPESPLALSRKPSSESLSLNQDDPLEPHDPGRHSKNVVNSRSEFGKRRPASNPNLRCNHQDERSKTPEGQVQKEEDKTNPKNPADASLYLRYYHVFKEGELTDLIERNIENLHIVKSYYDHANWCVVAEKVEVWRI